MTYDPTTQPAPTQGASLQELQCMGKTLSELKGTLDSYQKLAEQTAKAISQLEDVALPEMMTQLGLEEITLDTGHKITKKKLVFASVKDEHTAFQWLRDHDEDSIIKNTINVSLSRGDDELAVIIEKELEKLGVVFERKEAVHPSTLKAFIKEALADPNLADSLPRKAFGIYETERVFFK